MIKRILVPLDGSPSAENVLAQTQRLVARHAAEVLLLRAFDVPPINGDYVTLLDQAKAAADEYLRRQVQRLLERGWRARALLRQGHAADEILRAADAEGADLITMSTHGRTGLARFTLGSVTEKVIRASAVPVLAVRAFAEREDGLPQLAAPAELPFRKVLVPFDGSPLSMAVAPFLAQLLGPMDARVVMVHVVPPEWQDVRWTLPERPLKEAAEVFVRASIPVSTEVRHGDPASEILNACRDHQADLLAMSTHGRSGLSRWVLGSVTEKILRAAAVPLLVARARKETKHA